MLLKSKSNQVIDRLRAGDVDPLLWHHVRAELAESPLTDRKLTDLSATLGLRWPSTRSHETVGDYLHRDLPEVLSSPAFGAKRRRALFHCVAILIDPAGPDTLALEEQRVASRFKMVDEALRGLQGSLEAPGIEERIDRLGSALLDYAFDLRPRKAGRERRLLEKRFGIGLTASETLMSVGREAGVTRERIRQIVRMYGSLVAARHPSLLDAIKQLYEACIHPFSARQRLGVIASFLGASQLDRSVPIQIEEGVRRWSVSRGWRHGSPVPLEETLDMIAADIGRTVPLEMLRDAASSVGLLGSFGGRDYLYARSRRDRCHQELIAADAPLTLDELAARTGMASDAIKRLLVSEPRILRVDGDRLTVLVSPDGVLDDGRVALPLRSANGQVTTAVPLDVMCRFAKAIMDGLGLPNVTTEGFRDLCDSILERLLGARLDERFSLDWLRQIVGSAGGDLCLIQGDRIAARGIGRGPAGVAWVCRAVAAIGGPCIDDDVEEWMRAHYQASSPRLFKSWLTRGRMPGRYRLTTVAGHYVVSPRNRKLPVSARLEQLRREEARRPRDGAASPSKAGPKQ